MTLMRAVRETNPARRPSEVLTAVERRGAIWDPVTRAGERASATQLRRALSQTYGAHVAPGTTDADLVGLWRALPDALRGTDPFLITNRPYDTAMQMLGSDARFLSMRDYGVNGAPHGSARRIAVEERLGTSGDPTDVGAMASPTWYASMQLTHEAERTPGVSVRLQGGLANYGRVGFELRPEVATRATLLPADSFAVWEPMPDAATQAISDAITARGPAINTATAGVEQLRSLVFERLVNGLDARTGDELFPALRAATDDAGRARAVHDYLTHGVLSDGAPSRQTFIEAQVRGPVTPHDVARIRVANDPKWPRSSEPLSESQLDDLRDAARRWGIPVLIAR